MKVVAVFGASQCSPGDGLWEEGVACGRLLAEAGLAVATGGYGGVMEAVSLGAHESGGRVIGITAPTVFPGRTGANPYVSEEVRANSLSERIHELVAVADGAIALHGSIGTLTELMMAWNIAFIARFSGAEPLPVVAVGQRWADVVSRLSAALDTDEDLVTCVETAAEAVAIVADQVSD